MEKDPENLEYLRSQNVPDLVDGAIQQLVKEKPKDAGPWLAEYFDYPPHGIARGVKKLEGWIQLGCGDKPYNCTEKKATFAPDGKCPAELPDLSQHNNFMAEFLRDHKDIYDKYKDVSTPNGITLAMCMKTGVDNPGHPHIKTVGLTAGDEESYDVFKEIFDPIIDARHSGYGPEAKQPTDLDLSKVSDTDMDPDNKYIETTRVRTGRSIRGFRLPPTIGFEERRKLEALSVKGLKNLAGDLKGDYYPLHGSHSYAVKPNGMSEEKEGELRKMGNLFQEPDSTLLLASGMGRHWPDGRGVFHNEDKNLFVWVGEEDHLRIVSMQRDKNMKETFGRFVRSCEEVQKVLKTEGSDFMHSDHLGWVLTCPSNLGTGLRAGTMVNLPLLSARADFKDVLKKMRLQARGTGGVDSASSGGKWDISNADRIGRSEVELVNLLIEGVAQCIKWEKLLEEGKTDEVDKAVAALEG